MKSNKPVFDRADSFGIVLLYWMMQKVRVNSMVSKFRKLTVLGSQRSAHLTTFVLCQSCSLKFPTVAVPNSLWHIITEFNLTLSVYVMITSSAEVWGTSFIQLHCCNTEKIFFFFFVSINKKEGLKFFNFEVWKKIQKWTIKCFVQLLGADSWSKYTKDVNWCRLI